ncbi:MAG: YeeE/YedE family protein [Cyclobacteriaceae bacterium]|nr:YeeE/YedE family protein [Cyclobacteriaceae bacterium]
MKNIKFLFAGILFGIVLTKSEVISWYRIQEMFLFDNFHMYGVIGSAITVGIIITQLIKRTKLKSIEGTEIVIKPKDKQFIKSILGGTIFGMGWAMTGACPGPLYILVGNGFTVFVVVLLGAVMGTFVYGLLRNRLPH